MKMIETLITAAGLMGSGAALAHGMHAEAPAQSLLHVLVHHWPMLLLAASMGAAWFVIRKSH